MNDDEIRNDQQIKVKQSFSTSPIYSLERRSDRSLQSHVIISKTTNGYFEKLVRLSGYLYLFILIWPFVEWCIKQGLEYWKYGHRLSPSERLLYAAKEWCAKFFLDWL